MVKVRVFVPAKFYVSYILDVEDPDNLEEIISKLEKMDPSNWAEDPNFYEEYGFNFRNFIKQVTKEDIVIEDE